AKAVANALSARSADGERSVFLNVKGPELLNKYVGETERQSRVIFDRAREKADAGFLVVIFFDEMESLFRTRGSGVSA
ncbi:AAA family ATPase, partial [Micrococcus sp. SIMBA_144]